MPSLGTSKAIRFSTTTRGNGKVFTLISTKINAARWTATSSSADGQSVPAKVYTKDDGQHVLVVPALNVNQLVCVSVLDESGKIIAQAKHHVRAKSAELRSKVNTALHNPKVDGIRNCDVGLDPTRLAVNLTRMIPRNNQDDLLHINVFFATYDRSKSGLPITVCAIDQNGKSLALEEPQLLGDLVEEYAKYPGVYYRLTSFSIAIPMNTPWICIGASCPDSHMDQNFVCIQPHEREIFFTHWIRNLYGFEGRDPNYEIWLKDQAATETELSVQRSVQQGFATRPLFSLVVPLYHTPLDLFEEMASSVLSQSYPKLELVLVNSTPKDEGLSQAVKVLQESDERVRVITLEHNLGITENTNAGIDAASGDFVCFLDHDDVIEPDLLYWYANAVNEYPTTDLLYCNEDKLIDGHYVEPSYKPDWSPLLLESNNYVCHLLCIRRSVLDQLPRPTAELDGAQDHSLSLAAGELARNVYHVPKVLYHWRATEGSTAADVEAKPESLAAGQLAIEQHYQRMGIDAQVTPIPGCPHRYATTYALPKRPRISAIVAPGTDEDMQKTVRSLEALGWDTIDITTCGVADQSTDVSGAVADAAAQATGDYLLLLSAGVTLEDAQAFEQLVAVTMRDDVALAAPRIAFPDKSTYSNGLAFFNQNMFVLNQFHCLDKDLLTILPHELTITTSDCLMISREDYRRTGGIMRGTPPRLWGTLLCLAVRQKGLRVLQYAPASATRTFAARDLSLDIERIALEDATNRSYLLAQYPNDFRLFDHFYKPQF